MTGLAPAVQAIIDRGAAADQRKPLHDPGRAKAAYRRRLAATGLDRRILWIDDPADIWDWDIGLDRAAKAARLSAALAPTPAGASTDDRNRDGGFFQAMWRRGWHVQSDCNAVGRSYDWLPAATAWTRAAGWAGDAVMGHIGHWDVAGAGCVAAWNGAATRTARLIIDNPSLAWMTGRPVPLPIMPGATVRPLELWARTVDMLAAFAWSLWDGSVGRDVAMALACLDAGPGDRVADTLLSAYEPMIEAHEAGAFAHCLMDRTLVVLAAPAIWTDNGRLHRADGPAIEWPRTKVHAWKGVAVPEGLIMQPGKITPARILAEANQEVRRVMIEIYGYGRYMRDMGAVLIGEDRTGRLWRLRPTAGGGPGANGRREQPDDIAVVEVENGTVETDGSRKTYWLGVPPDMASAAQAVSWTYGLSPQDYEALAIRT